MKKKRTFDERVPPHASGGLPALHFRFLPYCSTAVGLAQAIESRRLCNVQFTPLDSMKSTLPALLSLLLLLTSALSLRSADDGAKTIRIKTGISQPLTDEAGVVWQADTGFIDGETIDRPGLAIANTKTPSVYCAERYGMSAFRLKVPNGKYTVKLHFAETYEGVYGPGERVFTFKVEDKETKDFDVWKKSGGGLRAQVETVDVAVTDGALDITFNSQIENPQINALEIIPSS